MFACYFISLLLLTAARRITELHQVVIIGAGISGLRASQVLNQQGVPHIILESKNRIGGRIAPMHFEEEIVDIGSSFYRTVQKNSSFLKAVNDIKWPSQIAISNYKNNYFVSKDNRIQQQQMRMVQLLEQKVSQQIKKRLRTHTADISVNKAMQQILDKLTNTPSKFKNMLEHEVSVNADLKGSDLSELSARHFNFFSEDSQMCPVGGMYKLFQKMFRPQINTIHLNQKVQSIEYINKYVAITTNKTIYMAKRVICSLPIGVLKSNRVKFIPSLPHSYQQAINSIGKGISNKLYVSFTKRFWTTRQGWLHFISNSSSVYPIAFIHPNQNKNILVYYISEQDSHEISKYTKDEIKAGLRKSLLMFFDERDVDIQSVMFTRWHSDEDFLGSFSTYQVGTKREHFQQMGRAIDKKLWFVGQHTHAEENGSVNGAYASGQRAAREIVDLYKIKVFLQFIPAFGVRRTKVYEKEMSESELGKLISQQHFISLD